MKLFHLLLFLITIGSLGAQNATDLTQTNFVVPQQQTAFEENKGQVWDTQGEIATSVKYHFQQKGFDIFMLPTGLAYQFTKVHYPEGYETNPKEPLNSTEQETQDALREQIHTETYRMDMELVNANPNPTVIAEGKSKYHVNYYNHNTLDVHSFSKLTYKEIYPGIDWIIYTTNKGVKYDFVVHPYADPNQIQMKFNHHENLNINEDGSFTLYNSMGSITELPPISFQDEQEIQTNFRLKEDIISFELNNYDNTRLLTIDPNLIWDFYHNHGGASFSLDDKGNLYVCGSSSGSSIASGGHQMMSGGGTDAFLAKFDSSRVLQWATYYGGNGGDYGYACTADMNENVYLAGKTNSTNNIAFNGHDHSLGLGGSLDDAFLVKFNNYGVRQWGTYYGGSYDLRMSNSGVDRAYDCITDSDGNVFLAGNTTSYYGIASGGHNNTFSGYFYGDAFLVKFDSNGVRQWGTYDGNCGASPSCAIDNNGNIVMARSVRPLSSSSLYYPLISKFNTNGTRQWVRSYGDRWGSYQGDFYGNDCAIDIFGNIYLAGSTDGTRLLFTSGVHQIKNGGGTSDAYLVKYDANGTKQWDTYYGGTDTDKGSSCAVDIQGNVYLAGHAQSSYGQLWGSACIASGGYSNTLNGTQNAFLAKFNTNGVREWGTYFGSVYAWSHTCIVDNQLSVYLAGNTNGSLLGSNFIAKFQGSSCPPSTSTHTITTCSNYTWNGQTYTNSGTYTQTYTNSAGCDSIAILNLTIIIPAGTDVQTACNSYVWIDGNTYTNNNNSATHTIIGGASNGCDSIVTLNLTINNNNTTSTDIQIACNSYTWIDGNTYTSSNNTTTFTLPNAVGCDSIITLNLTINNSNTGTDNQIACDSYTWIDGNTYTSSNNSATHTLTNINGCDSVVTLNLTINNSNTGTDNQTACDSYTWIDGNTYTSSNNSATHTLMNANGCDSVVTLNLTINNSNTGTDIQTACDSYTWIDGNTYTSSNNSATHTLTNINGCDSVVTLNLTINNSNTGTDNQTACDSYTWIDGNTYTSSNNSATHTLTNINGCDSVVTLNLTINNSNTGTDNQIACDSYTWIDGNTYTSSNNSAMHTLTNANGCDSVVTLNLTINHSNIGTDIQTACDSYTWIDGNTYTSSNNSATHTLMNINGCDSVVTLNLTINNSNTGTDNQTACNSYTWIDGNTYTSSNNSATHTLTNINGCDSVVTLNLTINNSNTGTDIQTACDSYTWIDGNTYTSSNNSATHTLMNANGCDSVVTLNLIINNSNTGTDNQTACDSYTWIDGNTYTSSNNSAMHTLTNANGCDSVVTLNLIINNSNTGTDNQIACDSYTWIDGNTYTSSNNSATHTLTNINGCDSVVTLNLTINNSNTGTDNQTACDSYTWIDGNTYTSSNNSATHTLMNANGCDSVVTLNLTINNSNTGTDIQTACDSYTWIDGNTYTSSNNSATHTLTNINGCDSVVTLNLTINNSNTGTDVQTACDSYTWIDGNTYTSSNNSATHTLMNANGCDSVVTLNLIINNSNTGTDNQTACDSYTWIDGNTYTSSNNSATHTLMNANGCDSVVTLNLIINNSNTGTDNQTACNSYTWIDGNTYTSNNNSATHTLSNINGCDSVVTLNLTINHSNTGTDIQTACDSYTWIDGNTYTSSNNSATHTLSNINGCDSVITLNLTINNSNTGTDNQTACNSYTWIDGNTYTSSNNSATHTLTNANGCDSVVTLNLIINTVDTTISTIGTTVIANTANATYQWLDCNNNYSIIIDSINQSFSPAQNGDYAVVITENGCVDTSSCINIVVVGMSDLLTNNVINIYPNPTTGNIHIDFGKTEEDVVIKVYSTNGKLLQYKTQIQGASHSLNLSETTGIYILEIRTNKGVRSYKVIKN